MYNNGTRPVEFSFTRYILTMVPFFLMQLGLIAMNMYTGETWIANLWIGMLVVSVLIVLIFAALQPRLPEANAVREADTMSGVQFERYCASILKMNGFANILFTSASGDYGADIIATKGGNKYVFQCKRYSRPVGNKAVQEVYTAKAYYNADVAVVMTNSTFSNAAIEQAKRAGVLLWSRSKLAKLIQEAKSNRPS